MRRVHDSAGHEEPPALTFPPSRRRQSLRTEINKSNKASEALRLRRCWVSRAYKAVADPQRSSKKKIGKNARGTECRRREQEGKSLELASQAQEV